MNQLVQGTLATGAAAFLSRYEGLRDLLPGDGEQRRLAAESFRRLGLPGPREEAWRYTSLRPLAEAGFHEALTEVGDTASHGSLSIETMLARLPEADGARLVFVDGRYRDDLSTEPTGGGFRRFGVAADFGRLARPDLQPLVALNTMLAEDGVLLDVADGVDAGTIQLVSIGLDLDSVAVAFHPRHAIRLGAAAKLALIEVSLGQGRYFHNPVTEIRLAEAARLTHVRVQAEAEDAFHLATLYVDIAEGATYDSFCLNMGARLSRVEVHATLRGVNGVAHLNAAQMLRGIQHADFTTVVRHQAPSCASRQTVKNVLTGRSRGVFQGKIEVVRDAQKTDGYQMNQALLLSPDAEVNSKPQLEIFADDVKCSHGATVGELDPEQMFYLRSRGLSEEEARALLVRAFLAEAFEPVQHEAARRMLEQAVDGWWAQS